MFAIMYQEIPSETVSLISVKAAIAADLIILAFAALPRCGPFLNQEGLGPPCSAKLVYSRGDPLVARGRFADNRDSVPQASVDLRELTSGYKGGNYVLGEVS